MKKINLIKQQIDAIIEHNLIKFMFSTEDDNSFIVDLYLLINESDHHIIKENVNNTLSNYNILLLHKDYYNISSFYYENEFNINIHYLFDLSFKFYKNIIILYDPFNLSREFKLSSLPYSNNEFANLIDDFSVSLYDYYQCVLKNDNLLSYFNAHLVLEKFILIYRGFYDSLNAKKKYENISNTMHKDYYNKLEQIVYLFNKDNYEKGIITTVYEVDKIVNCLPVNIITLFNIDFFMFMKKLINNNQWRN